jgi:hypothetical protein
MFGPAKQTLSRLAAVPAGGKKRKKSGKYLSDCQTDRERDFLLFLRPRAHFFLVLLSRVPRRNNNKKRNKVTSVPPRSQQPVLPAGSEHPAGPAFR